MTTKVPVELSSTPGIVDGSNATAITIDSSENVGIGVTPDSEPRLHVHKASAGSVASATNSVLTLENSTTAILQFLTPNSASAQIRFGDPEDTGAGYIQYGHSDNSLQFSANGPEKMRINSSGYVGIGTSSPATGLSLVGANNAASTLTLTNTAPSTDNTWTFTPQYNSGDLTISDDGTERMRLTAAGDLYFAQTSGSVNSTGTILQANGRNFFMASTTSEAIMHTYNNTSNSGAKYIISFRQNNTEVGSIEVSTSQTALVGSSDYRLKENVEYSWDATTRLKQLKPCRFNWIADETNTSIDGFLAHEVQDIVPEAVRGEKDAVYTAEEEANELGTEGAPKLQGIDQSKLIPLLVKTIQELEARIKTLEDA